MSGPEPASQEGILSHRRVRYAVVSAILIAHFLLAFTSAQKKSVTIDEPYHIAPGVSALFSGDFRMSTDSPPLMPEPILISSAPVNALKPPN